MKRLHLIFARAANGVIGKDGGLPWHLPEDLAHFKRTTSGHPVIMGRKTWDSLPAKFRPLPGRLNIVVTRQLAWRAEGAQCAAGLQQALELCPADSDAWVIGGAEIYREALAFAHTAVVTEIDQPFEGDARAPVFGPQWRELQRECHTAANGLAYSVVTYQNTATGD
ncbi:MAG: dihydrofolate reductase [Ramlibacter sp.]